MDRLPPTVRGPVLEIGCGAGQAAALLLARYPEAAVRAIDRSATQIARARTRLAPGLATGRLRLACLALEEAPTRLADAPFAVALAIDVNAFWTTPDGALRAAGALLAPGGRLVLVYEPPTVARVATLQDALVASLEAHGFTDVLACRATREPSPLLCVHGRWAGRHPPGGARD